jgi:hypothetical protein
MPPPQVLEHLPYASHGFTEQWTGLGLYQHVNRWPASPEFFLYVFSSRISGADLPFALFVAE